MIEDRPVRTGHASQSEEAWSLETLRRKREMKFTGKVLHTSLDRPSAKTAAPSGPLTYLTGASMIDGNGGQPLKDPVIVLEGKRIKKIGTAQTIDIPVGATVIDCSKYTLLPGMIDLHVHLMMANYLTFANYRVSKFEVSPSLQQMYCLFHAQMCLDMGFTTLRDLGLNYPRGLLTEHLCSVRDAINTGLFPGPRMLVAGWSSITGSHLDLVMPRTMPRQGNETADGPWELRKLTRSQLRVGCDVIKTSVSGGGATDQEAPDVRNMTLEELEAIVDETHAFHKTVAVHCFTPEGHKQCVKAGADTVEHMVFHTEESIDLLRESGISVTPTLSHRTDHSIYVRKELGSPKFVLDKMKKLQPFCYDTFQKMYAGGVKIAMGTDVGYDPEMGDGAKELQLYVDLGMTPMHAIQTTTKNAAEAMKMGHEIGTLEEGKIADIIAVDGDPLANIAVLQEKQNIKMVMRNSAIFVDRRPGQNKSAVAVPDRSWRISGS